MHKNPRGFGHADFFVPLPPLLSEIRLMKHRVHTLFVPLAFVLGLVTCDRIDDPVEGIIETIDETYDIPALEPLDMDVQRVLIEDFTGHQCGNCPDANLVLNALKDAHPDAIIPMAIHAGSLALTSEEYPTDWTSGEGNEYWNDLDIPVNPIGRVNRTDNEGTSLLPDQWEEALAPMLDATPVVGMQMAVDGDFDPTKLFVHVHATWLADFEGEAKLAVLILENDLVGPQLWYGNSPEYVEEYAHAHVLRGSITGAKGEVAATNPGAGDAAQFDYALTWNDDWIQANVEVVAVLTDVATGRVLQAISQDVFE